MNLKDEIIKWDTAVEAEAKRLIASGYSPYEAILQATDNVRRKRRLDIEEGQP